MSVRRRVNMPLWKTIASDLAFTDVLGYHKAFTPLMYHLPIKFTLCKKTVSPLEKTQTLPNDVMLTQCVGEETYQEIIER